MLAEKLGATKKLIFRHEILDICQQITDKNSIVVRVMNLILLKYYWSVKKFMEEQQLLTALPRKATQTSTSHGLDRL